MQGNDYDGSSRMHMVSRVNLALVLHCNLQRDFLILFHSAHHIEPILYSMDIPRPGLLSLGSRGCHDQLTLSQPRGADYANQIILAPPDFQTFRRLWYLYRVINSFLKLGRQVVMRLQFFQNLPIAPLPPPPLTPLPYTIYQSCVFSCRVMIMMDQAGCRCLGLPNSGEFHSIGASTRRSPI